MNIYFYADWLWANKKLEDSPIKFKYIWNKCPAKQIKDFFKNSRVVCLNDTDLEQNPETIKLINDLFKEKFPNKSVYEINSTKTKATNPELFKFASKQVKQIKKTYTTYKEVSETNFEESALPRLEDSVIW